MEKALINKVALSPLITIDLENFAPKIEYKIFDLKPFLFHELILREKDFRENLASFEWNEFKDLDLIITCSTDAIIPMWAYMLVAKHAFQYVKNIFEGSEKEYLVHQWVLAIDAIDISKYENKKLIIKGCSNHFVPASAYARITHRLLPISSSIMFGEPCSTVPIYKAPKEN